jgi:hypothetical protein
MENPLQYHLNMAQQHVQMALDLLYPPNTYKRTFFYRRKLGKAQSILIGLLVREVNKR